MSSFWDLLGERINDGTITKTEMLRIVRDLHSIDHAMDEKLTYILYKGYPNWTRKDILTRSLDLGVGTTDQIKRLISEHDKIHERSKKKD